MGNIDLKRAGSYATYLGMEFRLATFKKGKAVLTTKNSAYQNNTFDFSSYSLPNGASQEIIYVKNVDPRELTNAYDLRYKAIYQGEIFGAGVSHLPSVTLFWCGSDHIARDRGFKQVNKGEWEKKVDVSEVEIVTIKEPIDLSKYLKY